MSLRDIVVDMVGGDAANQLDANTNSDTRYRGVKPPSPTGASALSDTLDLVREAQGILIHAAGAVKVLTPAGTTVTLPALAVGVMHPCKVRRIFSTGTTVTGPNITLLYTKA